MDEKNFSGAVDGRMMAPNVPPDRMVDLFSSFSHLHNNNRVLVDMLRDSIHELRELRSNLRKQQHAFGLQENHRGTAQTPLAEQYGLTRRELEVAQLLAQGRSNQAIARELKISSHTARHHTQRILAKLDVHSRGEAGAKIRG